MCDIKGSLKTGRSGINLVSNIFFYTNFRVGEIWLFTCNWFKPFEFTESVAHKARTFLKFPGHKECGLVFFNNNPLNLRIIMYV